MRTYLLLIFLLMTAALPLAAFDDFFFDDMFEDIEDIEEVEDAYLDLLTAEDVEIGGRFSASVQAGAAWNTLGTFNDWYMFSAGGNIFLDARPQETLRFFAKADIRYPSDNPVRLFEFFADVSWKERLFIRAGKQTVRWSTGGFWSPSDILSIEEIDPDNIDAQREGPLALKASMPAGLHTLDLFIVGDAENIDTPLKIVPRAVLHVSPGELIIGAGFQPGKPVQAAVSAVLPAGDLTFYGEGLLLLDGTSVDGEGTAGIRWIPEEKDIALIGQYYYGLDNNHHSMVMASFPRVFSSDLGASLRWYSLWADTLTGAVAANLQYQLFDHTALSGSFFVNYVGSVVTYRASVGVEISGVRF